MTRSNKQKERAFRHVVVLMLENRSFDHVLGSLQASVPAIDGIPARGRARSNPRLDGTAVPQAFGAARRIEPDPMHETPNVLAQIDAGNAGFVADYERAYPRASASQIAEVMAAHAPGQLSAIHTLARTFAVCDGWFSAVPGPTWTNRLFAMSGTSLGRVKMPGGLFEPNMHRYAQPSVFRRIEEAGLRPGVFYGDFPLALLLADRRTIKGARSFRRLEDFAEAAANAGKFPDFAWIEPAYLGGNANDDHPPHDVAGGQRLIGDVYESLRSNPALFRETLLVITYDEHGGFYDHRVPPPAVPPDQRKDEYTFDRLGVRVPAVLVSPWIGPQVIKAEVDHCALLRSLQLRFGLGDLGRRVAASPDLLSKIALLDQPRVDMPVLSVPRPVAPRRARAASRAADARRPLDGLEQSIVSFSAWLDLQVKAPVATTFAAHRKALTSAASSRAVAAQRVVRFLRSKGAKV